MDDYRCPSSSYLDDHPQSPMAVAWTEHIWTYEHIPCAYWITTTVAGDQATNSDWSSPPEQYVPIMSHWGSLSQLKLDHWNHQPNQGCSGRIPSLNPWSPSRRNGPLLSNFCPGGRVSKIAIWSLEAVKIFLWPLEKKLIERRHATP